MPATHSPPPPVKPPPPRPVFTFTCAACETVAIRPEPVLPDHWSVETIGAQEYAYCGSCSADLPETVQ